MGDFVTSGTCVRGGRTVGWASASPSRRVLGRLGRNRRSARRRGRWRCLCLVGQGRRGCRASVPVGSLPRKKVLLGSWPEVMSELLPSCHSYTLTCSWVTVGNSSSLAALWSSPLETRVSFAVSTLHSHRAPVMVARVIRDQLVAGDEEHPGPVRGRGRFSLQLRGAGVGVYAFVSMCGSCGVGVSW